MQRCNICIEEDCKGKYNCHCDKCKNIDKCNKVLHPTIRITTKCTQSCKHCCFSCSPDKTDMMTVETSKKINDFLINNDIHSANIMGGEFFCNPDWKKIFDNIIPNLNYARLVTNGDWTEPVIKKLVDFRDIIKISISRDKWHTNKNIDRAVNLCEKYNMTYNVATSKETSDASIVPVGNSSYMYYGLYSMFGCYCHNPDHMYSFMIDEVGTIYKCGFGIWDYTTIDEHLTGGFDKEFKAFNKTFYSVWIPNCQTCYNSFLQKDV